MYFCLCHFYFQLFASVTASFYACPPTAINSTYVWFILPQVAGHSIQISSNQLVIDEAISSTGTHELSGGVTVQYSESSFTIRGPASASTGQRAEVRGYRQGWSTTSMPTGFFYNIYALLPNSHAEAATGLCTGQDTCPDLFEANQFIGSASSLFSAAEVSHLNQVCCGCYAPTIAIFLLTFVSAFTIILLHFL